VVETSSFWSFGLWITRDPAFSLVMGHVAVTGSSDFMGKRFSKAVHLWELLM
jgi:hypothetical protein